MELDHANLIQMLCFESRIIKKLLENLDDHVFEQPLFYKMQQTLNKEILVLTPIEVALESNQIIAINKIIDYCVKHQNHYCYSFLFEKNLIQIIEKGIKVSSLFESNIFCYTFELEDWPQIHHNNKSVIVPYNGSKFELLGKYRTVFKQLHEIEPKVELDSSVLQLNKSK